MAPPKSELRAFLDANVLFSAAYRDNASLVTLWNLAGVRLLASFYAAQEAASNLGHEDQQERLKHLLESMEMVESGADSNETSGIVLPDKDRPIFAAAARAKADFLLTGDIQHFGMYFGRMIGNVRILRPAEFLRYLAEQRNA